MSTLRWTFTEVATGDTYTFERNPDSIASPFPSKTLTFARAEGNDLAPARTSLGQAQVVDWQFGGPINTQSHDDALNDWAGRPGKVRVTDHLGRTFEIMITDYQSTERQATRRNNRRMRYVMKASVLRQIV